MDAVQRFISENQHQFGYIMQEASRQWITKDKVGALTVGDCNFVIEKYGKYHELLEKMERYEKALQVISYCDQVPLSDAECGETVSDMATLARKTLNTNE